ncbi:MAG TPA: helix-turn-helix domain-containing protein [Mucilaginibacter sp.]|nr:helix-turn-helix domain-containing protein [Mucilaginibacter sp.]
MVRKIRKRSDGPISSALDIIGDKWSLLIVRDIMMNGKNTYNEFLKSEEKIATNVLADRLSMLEEAGIIARTEHPESRAKIYYRLTEMGIDLMPVLVEMILWADSYLITTDAAKGYAEILRKDKEAIIKKLTEQMKQKLPQ